MFYAAFRGQEMVVTKPISTKMHGVLDYLTVGFALAFPRVLNCNRAFTNCVTALALGKLGYAMLTRHELGVKQLIPMKAHLIADAVGGATLCVLPFLTGEDDLAAQACAVGMGAFDIAAAPLTETEQAPARRLADDEGAVGGRFAATTSAQA